MSSVEAQVGSRARGETSGVWDQVEGWEIRFGKHATAFALAVAAELLSFLLASNLPLASTGYVRFLDVVPTPFSPVPGQDPAFRRGVTGMSIIDAILNGERDPIKLAQLRHGGCHHSEEEIALALEGTWRPEHLFELRQARELYRFHHWQITECDQQVEAELATFANRAGEKTRTGKPRTRGHKSNDVRFGATGSLFQALGVDLTKIEGIDVGTALVISAEICVDVSRFPTEKQFASWLRLCPTQDESSKTKRRRGYRKGKNRVAIALRMAAQSAGRTMTPLGKFYRRIRSRICGLRAVKATAHKLACLVYRMLKYGQEHVIQSMAEYEAKMKANMLKALERKPAAMGFQLSPIPTQ